MLTQYEYLDENEPIEAIFTRHDPNFQNSVDQELLEQLENEKFQNKKLTNELDIVTNSLKMASKTLEGVKKLNHKLEQDSKFYEIQITNLKGINKKFIHTINNLQSYRGYVANLLAKKNRTNQKIQRLVKELKNMQNIIRKKNDVIKQKTRAYEIAKLQANHLIRETYGI